MKWLALTLISVTLTLPAVSRAEVYRCQDADGNPIFSQSPCGDDAELVEIEVNENAGLGSDPGAVQRSLEQSQEVVQDRQRAADARNIRRRSSSQIARLREQRDQCEETTVRSPLSNGGVQYERAVAACKARFDEEIKALQDARGEQIDRLRDEDDPDP